MAKLTLATKLGLRQLYLSLDLPDVLVPRGAAALAPEDTRALQALERGLREGLQRVSEASS